jgi:osmotically-inducible protein OsmY
VPRQPGENKTSEFPRPDAKQAAEGAPPHEQKPGAQPKDADNQNADNADKQNDEAHGYSQDSGYAGSGGYAAEREAATDAQTHTKKPGNGHTHSDEQIRAHIKQRLQKERAPRASHLLVSVGEGVVTLSGEVDDESERKRLTDIVRGVGSVRELHDELSTRGTHKDVN